MPRRKSAKVRTHRKITLTLTAETDERLGIQARRANQTRSELAEDLLARCLRQIVVTIRGRDTGEDEAA